MIGRRVKKKKRKKKIVWHGLPDSPGNHIDISVNLEILIRGLPDFPSSARFLPIRGHNTGFLVKIENEREGREERDLSVVLGPITFAARSDETTDGEGN